MWTGKRSVSRSRNRPASDRFRAGSYCRPVAELEAVMRTTFACREFTDAPVSDEDLVAILELARFAPSGGNRQGWRVIAVRDQPTKDRLVELSLPALRLYVAQSEAGENPWNTIEPSSVDPATINPSDNSGVGWFRTIAMAPVLLVVGIDLRTVASIDVNLDRVGVVSGASTHSCTTSSSPRAAAGTPAASRRSSRPRSRRPSCSWGCPARWPSRRSCRWANPSASSPG